MYNKTRVAAIFATALILASLATASLSQAGTVAYFYNQSDSAAAISVTLKGKTTVTVKPVAPGHISAAINLPRGYPDPMFASAAMQKSLKDLGFPSPALIDITFHSAGGSTKMDLPLHFEMLEKVHMRALVYFMRVKAPGAAPEPEDMAAVAVRDSINKLATEGKALVAILDETQAERFRFEDSPSPLFNIWFRQPNGNVWNEAGYQGLSFVTPEQLKPGNYDLLPASISLSFKAAKTAKPIASLTAADLPPGKISIYLIRTPGKLEHVTTLSPQ